MPLARSAMVKDHLLRAPRLLQRIAQDRHVVEGAFLVDSIRHLLDCPAVPYRPARIEADRTKRVTDHLPDDLHLRMSTCSLGGIPDRRLPVGYTLNRRTGGSGHGRVEHVV